MEEKSNGYATLKFNIKNLEKEKIEKIHQAMKLLYEVGITFDFGFDDKFIDWELDWSLENAIVKIRPLKEKIK